MIMIVFLFNLMMYYFTGFQNNTNVLKYYRTLVQMNEA